MTRKKQEEQSKVREKIHETYEQNELDSLESTRHRARSITVGTAFGGVVEVNLRSDYTYLYAQMQPIEAVEIIQQLAAGIGVEIAMRPKRDFASWRGWEEVIEQKVSFDKIAWKGAAAWQLGEDHLTKESKDQKKLESKQPESKEIDE